MGLAIAVTQAGADVRLPSRRFLPLAGAGAALAVAAAAAAPANELLPGPTSVPGTIFAALALFAAFAIGLAVPLHALYGLVALVVLEGAVRKWLYNDVTVFLLKDFLLVGIYAAVLPRLTRADLRRPWWLVAPIAALVALALAYAALSASPDQAVIGLRTYVLYVPLLWAAPALLDTARRAAALLVLLVSLGAVQAALAVAQVLAGPGALNRLVSGALHGVNTIDGVSYLRPTGTFMHTGVLAAFLTFVVVAGAALVATSRRGRLLWAGLATFVVISGAIVYTSARTLLGSTVIVVAALMALLLARRRLLAALAVPVAFLVGFGVVFKGVPPVHAAVVSLLEESPPPPEELATYQHATVVGADAAPVEVRIPRAAKARYADDGTVVVEGYAAAGAKVDIEVPAAARGGVPVIVRDEEGTEQRLQIPPNSRIKPKRASTVTAHSADGGVIEVPVGSPAAGDDFQGGFLDRAASVNAGDTGLWEQRIRPQLELTSEQGLIGHGTGTMTLGARYSTAGVATTGESSYFKVAWELGWPGLVAFLLVLVAVLAAAVRGALHARPGARALALAGVACAVLVPLWLVLSYAFEMPVVQALYFLLAGCAIAAAPRPAAGEPTH